LPRYKGSQTLEHVTGEHLHEFTFTFLPSPQDPLFPAGLSTHLEPSSCTSDLALADHCARLRIILLTYLLDIVEMPVQVTRDRLGQ